MNLIIIKIFITLIMAISLTGCAQSSYKSKTKDTKGSLVLIIMPEQKCTIKYNGRNLTDEKILHPAHKECYYK